MKPRQAPIKRTRIRKHPRKPSEFARIYGSKERVTFVKGLGCVACTAIAPIFGLISQGKCDNAHTVTGGTGRKADYTTIIPLCAIHHSRYDLHLPPFDEVDLRQAIKEAAKEVERRWLEAHPNESENDRIPN